MKNTKKITLSAMMTALGVLIMSLGAVLEVMDLSACALASLFVAFVYIEIGSPFTWLVWICTSLLTFLFFPGSALWFEYLIVFGLYPILKGYIERLPRKIWWLVKIIFGNIVIVALIFGFNYITGAPLFATDKKIIVAGLYLLLNVCFVLYDIFLTVLVRYYMDKLHPRFKRFLK